MHVHHVNQVVLPGLVEASAEFWRSVFGLVDLPRTGLSGRPGAWLDGGSFQIHISERDSPANPDAHVAIAVDDVAVIRARCLAGGHPWEDEPADFGVGRGFTREPGGNRVEVVNDPR